MPDLPLCLGVHKQRACQTNVYDGFFSCGAILYLKALSFGAIPDIMIELIAYRCLSFCTFSFGHCVVSSSIYGF